MPTYEYRCIRCQERFEVVQSFTDDPLTTCALCGGNLRKVLHPVGIQFKGSGFYSTDRRGGTPGHPKKAEGADGGEKTEDAGKARGAGGGEKAGEAGKAGGAGKDETSKAGSKSQTKAHAASEVKPSPGSREPSGKGTVEK